MRIAAGAEQVAGVGDARNQKGRDVLTGLFHGQPFSGGLGRALPVSQQECGFAGVLQRVPQRLRNNGFYRPAHVFRQAVVCHRMRPFPM